MPRRKDEGRAERTRPNLLPTPPFVLPCGRPLPGKNRRDFDIVMGTVKCNKIRADPTISLMIIPAGVAGGGLSVLSWDIIP